MNGDSAASAAGLPARPTTRGPVRPFRVEDVTEVAALYNRAYRNVDDPPSESLREYFHDVFFTDPWTELEASPSLVFVDDSGAVRGFIGAHPRRFRCGDRRINAVAMGQLMVEPRLRRRGIAWILGSAILKGPQTLMYGTTASKPAAEMWRRMGFWNPPFGGLSWNLPVRAGAPGVARAWCRIARQNLARAANRHLSPDRREPSTPDTFRTTFRAIRGPAEWYELQRSGVRPLRLRPDPDPEHAAWLWRMAAESGQSNALHSCLVQDGSGQPIGWVVYRVSEERVAQVLELDHVADHGRDVLAAFRRQATAEGCVRIRGQCTTPALTAGAVTLGATVSANPPACVYHTNDPDVRSAIFNGEAFLSELDSESWLSFAAR